MADKPVRADKANAVAELTEQFRSSSATVLTPEGGSLAQIPLSMLNDGPWCGAGQNRFDADLFRVRKVRFTIRVQASLAGMRATGADYVNAGTSRSAYRSLPDYTLVFEVSPRNMNLGR